MSIRKDQYPNGLHIVFVVKPTNLACVNSFNLNPFTPIMPPANRECHGPCRNKIVEFKIVKKITKQEYLYATFGALGLFLGTYILVVLVSCIMCVKTWRVPTEPTLEDQPSPGTEYGSIPRNESENAEINPIDYPDDDSSMNEEDIDMLTDAELDKDVFRTKTFLFVADLARKSPSVLRKKSQLYQVRCLLRHQRLTFFFSVEPAHHCHILWSPCGAIGRYVPNSFESNRWSRIKYIL